MYDVIYDLVDSKCLLEVNRKLKLIDAALTNQDVNRSIYCKKLSQAIIERTLMGRGDIFDVGERPKYHIYPFGKSIPAYLASYGLSIGKVREMRKNIKCLINVIDDTIVEPSGNYLAEKDEERILSILSDKFPFWEIVANNRSMDILNIHNSHRVYSSLCGTNETATSFVIYMFNMRDKSMMPEYVFLHELGHALQMALTGSNLIVPDQFINFNNSLPNVKLEQGTYDASEAFADTFAIAVMRGTSLADFDPFGFPDTLNEVFEKFYIDFFKNIKG